MAGIKSLADLRSDMEAAGYSGSDESLISQYAQAAGVDPSHVANLVGYSPGGSLTSNRLNTGFQSYKANLWDVARAGAKALGLPQAEQYADESRATDQARADIYAGRAKGMGGIDSWNDVHDLRGAANFTGGLLAQTAPYMAEFAVTGGLGGALSGARAAYSGARVALEAAQQSGNAARITEAARAVEQAGASLEHARMVGGVAGSYPSSVGDIMSNQREQSGQTDDASAFGYGVPYAALNAFDPIDSAIARRGLARNAVGALDNIGGIRGGAARLGATMLRTGVQEAGNEAGQEVFNQLGRMAVDPSATLTDPAALGRYGDSALGGGLIGGLFGGIGGHRRSSQWRGNSPTTPDVSQTGQAPERMDLLQHVQLDDSFQLGPNDQYQRPATQAEPQPVSARMPGQMDLFDARGLPTYGADPTFGTPTVDGWAPSPAHEGWTSAPGAAPAPTGVPYTHPSIDTGGLSLAPRPQQADMFSGRWNDVQAPAPVQEEQAVQERDPSQRDLFATPDELRGQIVQRTGKGSAFTVKLAMDLAPVSTNQEVAQAHLDAVQEHLDKELAKLDKKVSGGSDMLTPEEYQAKRTAIEDKMQVVDAARDVVDTHANAVKEWRTNKAAERGQAMAQPGVKVGVAPQTSTTEQDMRSRSRKTLRKENAKEEAFYTEVAAEQASERVAPNEMDPSLVKEAGPRMRPDGQRELFTKRETPVVRGGRQVVAEPAAEPTGPTLGGTEMFGPRGGVTRTAKAKATVKATASPVESMFSDLANEVDGEIAQEQSQPAEAGSVGATKVGDEITRDGRPFKNVLAAKQAAYENPGYDVHPVDGGYVLRKRVEQTTAEKKADEKSKKDETVKAGIESLDSAMKEYDSAPKDESFYEKRKHGEKVKDAATYIYETSKDMSEPAEVRRHAKKLYDAYIDAKDVRYSQGAPAAQKMTKESLQSLVGEVLSSAPKAPEVEVVDNLESVLGDRTPAGITPKGGVVNGRVYLFRDNIESPLDAIKTIWHELFHHGLRKVLPHEAYVQTMLKLQFADPKVRAYATRWKGTEEAAQRKGTMPAQDFNALAVEEALADIAEDLKAGNAKPGLVATLQRWMADVADKLGLTKVARAIRMLDKSEAEKFVLQSLDAATGEITPAGDRLSAGRESVGAMSLDNDGQPQFAGNGLYIGYATPTERLEVIPTGAERVLNMAITDEADHMKVLGHVEMLFDGDTPVSIQDIEMYNRNQGAGRKAVEVLMAAAPGGKLGVSNIVTESQDFWEKMGVPLQNHEQGTAYDGQLDWENYARPSNPTGPGKGPGPAGKATGNGDTGAAQGDGGKGQAGPRFSAGRAQVDAKWELPEPEQHGRFGHFMATTKAALSDWRNNPGVLGWLTLRQLKERFADSKLVQRYADAELHMGQMAEQIIAEVSKVVKAWGNLPAQAQVDLGKVMLSATLAKGHVDRAWMHESNKHLRTGDKLAVDAAKAEFDAAKALYDALPDAYKRLYADARDAMQRQWDQMSDARIHEVLRAFKPELQGYFSEDQLKEIVGASATLRKQFKEDLKHSPLPINVKRAMFNLIEAVNDHYEEASQMQGPYFPLVRFGDHVVVARSTSFKKVMAAFTEANDKLQSLYNQELPEGEEEAKAFTAAVAEARKDLTQKRKFVEQLKANDKHYSVTFFEHRWEADAYHRQLTSAPGFKPENLEVSVEQRAKHYQAYDSASPQFMRKLEAQLRTALPKADAAAVQGAVRELYLRSLPDRSALKGELRRLNVAGARSTEMLRGYASRSMANAHRISRMTYAGEMNEALAALRKSDNRDEMLVGDEFAQRAFNAMQAPKRSKVLQRMAQLSHLSMLGMSPSYILMNASQPWAISMPIMAARHNWNAARKALADATGEVFTSMKALRTSEADRLKSSGVPWAEARSFRFDIQPEQLGKTDGEKRMLRELFNDGLIDITLEHDMGTVASGGEASLFDKVNQIASTPAHLVEVVNRVATALAAYRLEQHRDRSHEAAVNYASKIVGDTHLDYGSQNTARLMRADAIGGLGRLVFQFKKYLQGMIYLQGKLLRDTLRLAKGENTAEYRESAKAFAYLNGLTLAVAGSTGFFGAGAIGLLAKALSALWDDDDEPDIPQMTYNGLKDVLGETAARAVWKGLPAAMGIDLSQRMGMSSLTNPLPFVNWDKKGKDLFTEVLMGIAGPTASLGANYADAMSLASSDPTAAFTKVLPKVLADPLRAYDRGQRGIMSRSGQEIMGRDELSGLQDLLRAVGYETTDVTDMYENRSSINQTKADLKTVHDRLVRQYMEAKKDGDVGDAMSDIRDFNSRNPHTKITLASLHAAAKSRAQSSKEMKGGARVGKRDIDVLDQVGLD